MSHSKFHFNSNERVCVPTLLISIFVKLEEKGVKNSVAPVADALNIPCAKR